MVSYRLGIVHNENSPPLTYGNVFLRKNYEVKTNVKTDNNSYVMILTI